jgi:NAD(P)-dependent dehydrogenase (short-subunit alcohol dehydrogenase family)
LVNSICIGLVKSAFWEERYRAEATDLSLHAWYDSIGDSVPVGRLGDSEEVADLVACLASSRAAFIIGASINIDGGASPAT